MPIVNCYGLRAVACFFFSFPLLHSKSQPLCAKGSHIRKTDDLNAAGPNKEQNAPFQVALRNLGAGLARLLMVMLKTMITKILELADLPVYGNPPQHSCSVTA